MSLDLGLGFRLSAKGREPAGEAAPADPYAANPVNFDGTNDFLSHGSALTGATEGKLWTGSLWVRHGGHADNRRIFVISASNGADRIFARLTTSHTLQLFGATGPGTTRLNISSSAMSSGAWHHLMWSLDMADTAKRHLYVDGVSDLATVSTYTNDDLGFDQVRAAVGARPELESDKFNGDMADLQTWFGIYVDLSVAGNRELFLQGGKPVDPAEAEAALGDPIVRLSGATNAWHTNKGTGGGFTLNGALTDGTGPVEL